MIGTSAEKKDQSMNKGPTSETKERLNRIIDRMRRAGCRITPQRREVLQILTDSKEHLTAEQVYERLKVDFPTTSLATVYNTLALLTSMGEVLELSFGEGSKRYDANSPSPHPHLVCVECGEIADIVDIELEGVDDLVRQVETRIRFEMLNYRIDFFGICQKCQRAKQESENR
jgi:Fur family peroxide stress response transcriptional regulator